MKSTKAYAIKDPEGNLIPATASKFEENSKDTYLKQFSYDCSEWEQCEDQGYRCVPVEITEIKYE